MRYDWLIALYIFTPLVRNTIFKHKKSCVKEELSDLQFFLPEKMQQTTVEECIFGEFTLAHLTFG